MKVSPCCNAPFVLLSSLNIKRCADCGKEYPWHLTGNQKSVLIEGLTAKNFETKYMY